MNGNKITKFKIKQNVNEDCLAGHALILVNMRHSKMIVNGSMKKLLLPMKLKILTHTNGRP